MKLLRIILASIVMMTLSGISVFASDDTVTTVPVITDPTDPIIVIDDGSIPMEKNIDGTGAVDPVPYTGGSSVDGSTGTEVPPDVLPVDGSTDPIVTTQEEPVDKGTTEDDGIYYMTGAENQRSVNSNDALIQIAFASGFVVIAYALSKKLSKS